jgi:hypothetical protein
MLQGGSMTCFVIIIDHDGDTSAYSNSRSTILSLGSNSWRQGAFQEYISQGSNFTSYKQPFDDIFPTYQDVYQCYKTNQSIQDCTLSKRSIEGAPWPFHPQLSFDTVKSSKQLVNVLKKDMTLVKPTLKKTYKAIIDAIESPKLWPYRTVGIFYDSF